MSGIGFKPSPGAGVDVAVAVAGDGAPPCGSGLASGVGPASAGVPIAGAVGPRLGRAITGVRWERRVILLRPETTARTRRPASEDRNVYVRPRWFGIRRQE